MMITREESTKVLYDLINSGILDSEIAKKLNDICNCIEEENCGRHIWGADDDFIKLHIAYRSDLITDELESELNAIADKYTFSPAPYEKAAEADD